LESKKDMKSRGLASPDAADALACTFAFPVASRQSSYKPDRVVAYSDRNSQAAGWMGA
jgi:hypothetical protein